MIRSPTGYLRSPIFGTHRLIALVRPDGSGKSTLVFAIGERFGSEVSAYPMQRAPLLWREVNPRLLDLNAALRGRMLGSRPGPVRKALAAVTHSLEYLEQHLRLASILARSPALTITDGYLWDPVIRWRPRAARTPFWWTLLLARAFPNPRLTVLCVGDPHAIWSRKPDMRLAEVRATLRQYPILLRRRGIPYIEIDTTSSPVEESIRSLASALGIYYRDGSLEASPCS